MDDQRMCRCAASMSYRSYIFPLLGLRTYFLLDPHLQQKPRGHWLDFIANFQLFSDTIQTRLSCIREDNDKFISVGKYFKDTLKLFVPCDFVTYNMNDPIATLRLM